MTSEGRQLSRLQERLRCFSRGGSSSSAAVDKCSSAECAPDDAAWILRIVAAVTLVNIAALDLAARELLGLVDDVPQSVTVIGVAGWPAILRPMSRISRPSLLRRMRNCRRWRFDCLGWHSAPPSSPRVWQRGGRIAVTAPPACGPSGLGL